MDFHTPSALPKLMVAPNGARRTKQDHPAIPVTLEQTVETAKKCYQAGAEAIHFHLRDDKQQHILDAGLYNCLLYTSPSPRDRSLSRMPSSA